MKGCMNSIMRGMKSQHVELFPVWHTFVINLSHWLFTRHAISIYNQENAAGYADDQDSGSG
jgi:hypothetical protein